MSTNVSTMDWQLKLQTVRERDKYILENEMWTDCTFVVGEEKKVFKCHRLQLAKTSPVMAAMLYGKLFREGEDIRVPDISPQVFEAMIRYIYHGQVQIDNYELATGLLYAAKKYLLPKSLVKQCRSKIVPLVNKSNVWTALEFASSNDEPKLEVEILKMVQNRLLEFLAQPDFKKASQSTVSALVKKEDLMIVSEFDLFETCLGWARSQVTGDEEDPAALREVLAPILPHIRFLTMTSEQLAKGPIKSGVLTESEGLKLLMTKVAPDLKTLIPEGLSSVKIPRRFIPVNSETFIAFETTPDNLPTAQTWSEYKFNNNAWYRCNIIVSILGVQLPTQVKMSACDSDTYNEDLTVLVYNEFFKKVHSTRFTANVKYDSVIDVPFKEVLSSGFGSNLQFRVVFHTTGLYPHKYKKTDVPEKSTFGHHQRASYLKKDDMKYIYKIVCSQFN